VSDGLWITGPDHHFVAEDHVLALADFVKELALQIDHSAGVLRHVESQNIEPPEGFLSTWSFHEVARIRFRVERLREEAQRLHLALWDYARATADQERARIETFDVPRDRLIALMLVTLARSDVPSGFESWGFSEVAQAIIPATSVFDSVSVSATRGVTSVHPAGSFVERVGRIPHDSPYPIRIERFVQPDGSYSTDVYIAGTRDLGVGYTREPFDMESNIALIAGATATSFVAVEAAMKASGVRPGDKVTFVGHSQGGLIAARLAESGRYSTTGLLTVGAPLGGTPVRGDYPAVAITHRDDVVPELGGHAEPSRAVGVSTLSGAALGDVGGAHSLDAYTETAEALDSSPAKGRVGELPTPTGTTRPTFFQAQRN